MDYAKLAAEVLSKLGIALEVLKDEKLLEDFRAKFPDAIGLAEKLVGLEPHLGQIQWVVGLLMAHGPELMELASHVRPADGDELARLTKDRE